MSIPKFKEPIVYYDVDDTLVSWRTYPKRGRDSIEFEDPHTKGSIFLNAITPHIDALKSHKLRGHTVIVWSAGGADWAEEVVRKLNLSAYVDACMSKPNWFYDDLPASEFMPEINRKYFPNKTEVDDG